MTTGTELETIRKAGYRALFDGVAEDALNVSWVEYQCIQCREVSGLADIRHGGMPAADKWAESHRMNTGHRRFYRIQHNREIVEK